MGKYDGMLMNVFGYVPEGKEQDKKDMLIGSGALPPIKKRENRDVIPVDTFASVQSILYGNGDLPPPKAPNANMAEKMGTAPVINQQGGWGSI